MEEPSLFTMTTSKNTSEQVSPVEGNPPNGKILVRTKILAYLGQLKKDEWRSAPDLCRDLSIRYSSAKNTLEMLEERGLIEKVITNRRGIVAVYRIDPRAAANGIPYVPPEWHDGYGKHPHAL